MTPQHLSNKEDIKKEVRSNQLCCGKLIPKFDTSRVDALIVNVFLITLTPSFPESYRESLNGAERFSKKMLKRWVVFRKGSRC